MILQRDPGRTWSERSRKAEVAFVQRRATPLEVIARRVVKAVEKGKPRLLIGRDTYLIDVLSRAMPSTVLRLIGGLRHRFPFLPATT